MGRRLNGLQASNTWESTFLNTWPGVWTPHSHSRKLNNASSARGRNKLPEKLLISLYRCTSESFLTYWCAVWFSSCTAEEKTDLQRVVRTAQWIACSPQIRGGGGGHPLVLITDTGSQHQQGALASWAQLVHHPPLRQADGANQLRNSFSPRAGDMRSKS